jgi:hypothetical protein
MRRKTMTATAKWAAVQDGLVLEVTDVDPAGRFTPDYAGLFIPCPEEARSGWVYDGEAFSPPPSSTSEETALMRKAVILARLSEIDAASVRPLRAIAQGEDVQADHDRLAALDGEAAGLRAELAGLAQAGASG